MQGRSSGVSAILQAAKDFCVTDDRKKRVYLCNRPIHKSKSVLGQTIGVTFLEWICPAITARDDGVPSSFVQPLPPAGSKIRIFDVFKYKPNDCVPQVLGL